MRTRPELKLKDSDKGTTAFWVTFATVVGTGAASVVGAALQSEFVAVWFIAAGAVAISAVIAAVLTLIGYRVEAFGVLLAAITSIPLLLGACFANLIIYDFTYSPGAN